MIIENDLATFPSTYKKDYKWFPGALPSEQYKDFDPYELSPKKQESFQTGDIITSLTPEQKKVIMKQMIDKLMQSVYVSSYSLESLQTFKGDPKKLYSPENDKLLTIAQDVYKSKYPHFKTVLPLPTSRRVLGFCRLRDYYMGISEYQDTISRVGYQMLKEKADKGYWRLGPKKIPVLPPTILKCKK